MDDHGNSRETATVVSVSGMTFDPVRRQGEIKPKADEDWFRVKLQQGKWYWLDFAEIRFVGVPMVEFYSGDKKIDEFNGFTTRFYRARKTGDFYVRVFQGNSPGGRYLLSVSGFQGPNVVARAAGFQARHKSPFWRDGGVFGTRKAPPIQFFYQVGQSDFTLSAADRIYVRDQMHEIAKPQAKRLEISVPGISRPVTPGYFYARLKWGKGYRTWTRTSVQPLPDYGIALGNRFLKGRYFSYSFDDQLPSYFQPGEVPGFQPLSETQKQAVREAIQAWGKFVNLELTEVDSGRGMMRIGAGSLDADFLAFQRTSPWYRFSFNSPESDFFIDPSRISMQDLTPGSVGYFRLLQSVGVALGFNQPHVVDSRLPSAFRNTMFTVMSNQQHPKFGDTYPDSPGLLDILQVQSNYSPSRAGGKKEYRFAVDERSRTSIMAGFGIDTVSAEGHQRPAVIRLEAGEFSYIGRNYQHFWVNGVDARDTPRNHTWLENGIGGKGADRLVGGKENNRLFGGPGADVMIGRQGEDFLNGGTGNDRYLWLLGDGSDTVFERKGSGVDLLQIQSEWGLDSLSDDLAFRRSKRDLVINLDFENANARQGRIRIRNMDVVASRIESLRLLGQNGQVIENRISLASVWSELKRVDSPGPVRMQLGTTRDRFGKTVIAMEP